MRHFLGITRARSWLHVLCGTPIPEYSHRLINLTNSIATAFILTHICYSFKEAVKPRCSGRWTHSYLTYPHTLHHLLLSSLRLPAESTFDASIQVHTKAQTGGDVSNNTRWPMPPIKIPGNSFVKLDVKFITDVWRTQLAISIGFY